MIRGIFFDGGGVIAHFDEDVIRSYERVHGLAYGDVMDVLYSGTDWMDAERGALDEDEWLKRALARLAEGVAPLEFQDLRETWDKAFLKLDRQMIGLVEVLARSYPIGLLTNSSSSQQALKRKLSTVGILGLWDTIVNSSDVGVAKPDERIYKIAADCLGLQPEECVHIDDKLENVAGAKSAGFQAIHYAGDLLALRANLRRLGIALRETQ